MQFVGEYDDSVQSHSLSMLTRMDRLSYETAKAYFIRRAEENGP